jgi:hypothetical protein
MLPMKPAMYASRPLAHFKNGNTLFSVAIGLTLNCLSRFGVKVILVNCFRYLVLFVKSGVGSQSLGATNLTGLIQVLSLYRILRYDGYYFVEKAA